MADIDVREPGAAVTARAGDRFRLTLDEIATTGYRWRVDTLPAHLELEIDEPLPPGSAAPGAGGAHRFVLRAARRGSGVATFALAREWEPEPAERFTFTATVT